VVTNGDLVYVHVGDYIAQEMRKLLFVLGVEIKVNTALVVTL
jgi:hypothetical protein